MAKKPPTTLIKLVSSAKTGFFYIKKRCLKKGTTVAKKLSFKKYDPKIRKHVIFNEQALKK